MKRERQKSHNLLRELLIPLLCSIFIFILIAPLACTKYPDDEISTSSQSEREIEASIAGGSEQIIHSLNLRYQDVGSLNPLQKQPYVNRALFKLVYDSLFTYDTAGLLQRNLADKVTFNENKVTYKISIKDKFFHNGEKITVQDVEASFRQYLKNYFAIEPADEQEIAETEPSTTAGVEQNGDETVETPVGTETKPTTLSETSENSSTYSETSDKDYSYYIDSPSISNNANIQNYSRMYQASIGAFKQIKTIATQGNYLIIELKENLPLLDLLTFPIVPAEYVENTGQQIIPGSGKFTITNYDADKNLFLSAKNQSDSNITEIKACHCRNIFSALELFETGKIDIMLMNREESARLEERNLVKSQRYSDSGYVSLFFPNKDMKELIQALINNLEDKSSLTTPFEYSPIYRRRADFRQSDINMDNRQEATMPWTSFPTETIIETPTTKEDTNSSKQNEENVVVKRTKINILMPRVYYPLGLKHQLSSLIYASGAEAEFKLVEGKNYLEALEEKDYDIAVLLDESASYGDPYDYLSAYIHSELLNLADLKINQDQINILKEARKSLSVLESGKDLKDKAYARSLNNVFAELPIIGLCTTSTMLWYNDNVDGILNGSAEMPYQGVEYLQVWQP